MTTAIISLNQLEAHVKECVEEIARETIANAKMLERAIMAGHGGTLAIGNVPDTQLELDFHRVFNRRAPRHYWDMVEGQPAEDVTAFQQAISQEIYRQRMAEYMGGAK